MSLAKKGKVFEQNKLLQPLLDTHDGPKMTCTSLFFTSPTMTVYSIAHTMHLPPIGKIYEGGKHREIWGRAHCKNFVPKFCRLKLGEGKGGSSTLLTKNVDPRILTKRKIWVGWWDGVQQNLIPNFGQDLNRPNVYSKPTRLLICNYLDFLCFFFDGSSLNVDVQSVRGSFDNTRKWLNRVYICRAQEPVTFYWGS